MDNNQRVSEKRHRTMSHIKSKDTKIEVLFRKALWHKGYRFRKNYSGLPGKPDIVLTKYKIAIFCDSEFFHGRDWDDLLQKLRKGNNANYWETKIKRNIDRDEEINKSLRAMGWTVLRFWGKEIERNIDDCLKSIEEAIMDQKMAAFPTSLVTDLEYELSE